jgi:hypothetical protein
MDRHRQAHPSSASTQPAEVDLDLDLDLDLALQRAHFRLLGELYRQRRPVGKRRTWPSARTADVVVPITSARRWRGAGDGAS